MCGRFLTTICWQRPLDPTIKDTLGFFHFCLHDCVAAYIIHLLFPLLDYQAYDGIRYDHKNFFFGLIGLTKWVLALRLLADLTSSVNPSWIIATDAWVCTNVCFGCSPGKWVPSDPLNS